MAPVTKYAASVLAALAGVASADQINWQLVDAAGAPTSADLFSAPPYLAADPVIANYTIPVALLNATIRAPLDCKAQDTYLGQQVYNDGALSVSRCADACTAQRNYDAKYLGKKPCRFFNTYVLVKSDGSAAGPSTPVGQVCSLYTETWPAAYGNDKGQWRGNERYLVLDSFAASYAAGPSSGDCDAQNPGKDKAAAPAPAPPTTAKPVSTTTVSGVTTKTVTTTTTTKAF
ncbi:hypothetical protein PG990_013631 [Apiospora arundinis]|uniref:Glycoside hydrolase n=1 Tax=Apiospora arundinis TaxID=335852 RepID=A0ABR2IBD6_9PEZI